MPVFPMTAGQFDLVYNASSFTLASMMASTIFFWLRVGSIHEKYKSALVITGLVTFIAAYHYFRIFNSWVDAYTFPAAVDGVVQDPVITGIPFNDAYRYMDWLLTVPLLLIEIIFVMNLSEAETASKATSLGVASGLMIIFGYPGEGLIEDNDLGQRWVFWTMGMIPFLYVIYTLLVGLKATIAAEVPNCRRRRRGPPHPSLPPLKPSLSHLSADRPAHHSRAQSNPAVRDMLNGACYATVISWCTYPVVYVFPMIGFSGSGAVVAIQLGYCVADIISKCGVGFLIYNVTTAHPHPLSASHHPPPACDMPVPASRVTHCGSGAHRSP